MSVSLLCSILIIVGVLAGVIVCRLSGITLKGRMGRVKFAGFYLLAIAVLIATILFTKDLDLQTWADQKGIVTASLLFLGLVILLICLVWSLLSLHVKRLHDLNLSGWWVILIVALNVLIAKTGLGAFSQIIIILLVTIPGSKELNRYD